MVVGTASATKAATAVKDDGIAPAPGRRFHDAVSGTWMVKVFPGEFYITAKADETIVTILGSCVAACIRDPVAGIGGMNHFMLPHDKTGHWGGDLKSTRYGNFAMEKLLNELIKSGAKRERLEIKVFGGGNVTDMSNEVGTDNGNFVLRYLQAEGLKIAAQDLFGDYPRRIQYAPATGKVVRKFLGTVDKYSITREESEYASRLSEKKTGGEIELFE
ncbi:MAG: chemoreceptor glutamine deamidase CheD [Pseudolabrys sp.]